MCLLEGGLNKRLHERGVGWIGASILRKACGARALRFMTILWAEEVM